MKTTKLVIGIISINLFCICFLQASLLSLVTGFVNIDIGSAAGLLLSFCMLTGGLLAISTRDSRVGGYVSGCFFLAGTVVALFQKEAYEDLWVWMSVCFVFGIIMIICSAVANRKAEKDEQIEDKLNPTELLKLQKILIGNSTDSYILPEEQLYQMAQDRVSNYMKTIRESTETIETTTDIDTFFEKSNLIMDTYKMICQFEDFFPFDEAPAVSCAKFSSKRESELKNFVYRHVKHLIESAEILKTEEEKQEQYRKSYKGFQMHYDSISAENKVIIETEYKKFLQ